MGHERISAVLAYQHEWFRQMATKENLKEKRESTLDEQVMMNQMKSFLQQNRIKRVALQIIARQVSDESIEKLRAMFLSVDTDHSGSLTTDEMDVALEQLSVNKDVRESF